MHVDGVRDSWQRVQVIEDRPYHHCLIYGSCGREPGETAGSTRWINKSCQKACIVDIVHFKWQNTEGFGEEGIIRCIPIINYPEKYRSQVKETEKMRK